MELLKLYSYCRTHTLPGNQASIQQASVHISTRNANDGKINKIKPENWFSHFVCFNGEICNKNSIQGDFTAPNTIKNAEN